MNTELKPLKVHCDTSDCENGLHCFRVSKRKATGYPAGHCQKCGIDLIKWDRVHARKYADVSHTIESLKREWIRHYHWHGELNTKAQNYCLRKGKAQLRVAVENRLDRSIKPKNPWRDGAQTPFGKDGELPENPIHAAQHATATCCRKCVEYWHAIPSGLDLFPAEIQYLVNLIMEYFDEKMPDLNDEGIKIPRKG